MSNYAHHGNSLPGSRAAHYPLGAITHGGTLGGLEGHTALLTRGEVCAGYDGLGIAIDHVLGSRPAWFSEFDAAPSKILAYHFPGVPNYGDMTQIDWAGIEQVDVISGGTPCQDLSTAGRRAGMNEGTRSNLWVQMREAVAVQRPKWVVWENVRGAFSAEAHSEMEHCPGCMGDPGDARIVLRALGRVLGDLSDLGYDAQWRGLRAADVGSCHSRFRVFVLARDTHRSWEIVHVPISRGGRRGAAGSGQGASDAPVGSGAGGSGAGPVAADSGREISAALQGILREGGPSDQPAQHRGPVADTQGASAGSDPARGLSLEPGGSAGEPAAADTGGLRRGTGRIPAAGMAEGGGSLDLAGGRDGTQAAADAEGGNGRDEEQQHLRPSRGLESGEQSDLHWGAYEPGIRRWEQVTGRPAPRPTEPTGRADGQRLNPRFAEWMMGVPDGWITSPAIGISRSEQLKACGNGVVPQQAAAALADMLAHFEARSC